MERRARWRSRGGEDALVLPQSLAGVAPAIGKIWSRAYSLIWSACGYKNMSGGCIREPKAVWSKREGAGWPYLTVNVDGSRRLPRDPELCCRQPRGSRVQKREGKRRGERGVLIGAG
jgi:hypothetical protein